MADSIRASANIFVGYGSPMQPLISCPPPCSTLFIVTKTPQRSLSLGESFLGFFRIFPVVRHCSTAFRASLTRNSPSSWVNWNDTKRHQIVFEVSSFFTGIIMLMENKSGIENETKLVLRKFHGFFADAFFS